MSDTQPDPIRPGDRVQWTQREGHYRIKPVILSGVVRSIKHTPHDDYAVVDTYPDGRITLPSLDKLTKIGVAP